MARNSGLGAIIIWRYWAVVSMLLRTRQAWALATLALHVIPIALIWLQWQQWRLESASSSKGNTIEVRLYPQLASISLASSSDAGSLRPAINALPVKYLEHSEPVLAQPIRPAIATNNSAFELPIYLTAGELDTRPQPTAPLAIPFPDVALSDEVVTGMLILYIGFDGKVDKVEVLDSTLPPLFEQVARESFLNAQMHPGIKDGKPVRSLMKVVVEFESRSAF